MRKNVFLSVNPKTGGVGARTHIYEDCLYLGHEYISVPKEVAWEKYEVTRPCQKCVERLGNEETMREAAKEGGGN